MTSGATRVTPTSCAAWASTRELIRPREAAMDNSRMLPTSTKLGRYELRLKIRYAFLNVWRDRPERR